MGNRHPGECSWKWFAKPFLSLTCRKRHVKCDEAKPSCGNCNKKTRTCQYESAKATGPRKSPSSGQRPPSPLERQDITRDATSATADLCSPSAAVDINFQLSDYNASPSAVEHVTLAANSAVTPASPISSFLATLGSVLLDSDSLQPATVQSNIRNPLPNCSIGPLHAGPQSEHLHVDQAIQLAGTEIPIFRNYVENVSHWASNFLNPQCLISKLE